MKGPGRGSRSTIAFRTSSTSATPLPDPAPFSRNLSSDLRPVEKSHELLDHLHRRWVVLLQSLSAPFPPHFPPSVQVVVRLDTNLALSAWPVRHHAAHITGVRQRRGWQ